MQITFSNWEKYQPRKDIKSPTWVAVKNDFAINQNFHKFLKDEKLCFIYLLCEASKTNKNGMVIIDFDYHSELFKISIDTIKQTIEKLKDNGICTQSVRARTRSERTRALQTDSTDSTGQDKTNKQSSAIVANAPETVFNLDELYQLYPLKKGKSLGMEKLKRVIRSQKDFDDFKTAINKYTQDIKSKGTEPRYIKQFSTFVGSDKIQPWRDWLDDGAGEATVKSGVDWDKMEWS